MIGSPPPSGRDLDLLVRRNAAERLESLLTQNGFHCKRGMWARFVGCRAEVVELIPADSWELDAAEVDRLFAEGEPIDGLPSLLLPSPHHQILLTALRASNSGRLQLKHRERVGTASPEAWRAARELAPRWQAAKALSELDRTFRDRPPARWRTRSVRVRGARYRPGTVIAFSGLDGSGKSTQVEALAGSLSALGYPSVAVWTRFGGSRSLKRLTAPLRAILRHRDEPAQADMEQPPSGEDGDPLTRIRERLPFLQSAWITFVAATTAWWMAREIRPKVARGRIVVCDRYTLDALVQMRYRYGEQHRYKTRLRLISSLAPKPSRAYLLDVAPETAYARNREYTLPQIEMRTRLYREEHGPLGVIRMNGELPADELCAELALDVWSVLSEQRDETPPLLKRPGSSVKKLLRRRIPDRRR